MSQISLSKKLIFDFVIEAALALEDAKTKMEENAQLREELKEGVLGGSIQSSNLLITEALDNQKDRLFELEKKREQDIEKIAELEAKNSLLQIETTRAVKEKSAYEDELRRLHSRHQVTDARLRKQTRQLEELKSMESHEMMELKQKFTAKEIELDEVRCNLEKVQSMNEELRAELESKKEKHLKETTANDSKKIVLKAKIDDLQEKIEHLEQAPKVVEASEQVPITHPLFLSKTDVPPINTILSYAGDEEAVKVPRLSKQANQYMQPNLKLMLAQTVRAQKREIEELKADNH